MFCPLQSVFRVGGMTCSACSGAVENALKAMPGVKAAQVPSVTLLCQPFCSVLSPLLAFFGQFYRCHPTTPWCGR